MFLIGLGGCLARGGTEGVAVGFDGVGTGVGVGKSMSLAKSFRPANPLGAFGSWAMHSLTQEIRTQTSTRTFFKGRAHHVFKHVCVPVADVGGTAIDLGVIRCADNKVPVR